jgi:hypothetical protein
LPCCTRVVTPRNGSVEAEKANPTSARSAHAERKWAIVGFESVSRVKLLFHNEMSVLLIFLMGTNMIAGVLILPAFIAWQRPWFIARYERKLPPPEMAATRS